VNFSYFYFFVYLSLFLLFAQFPLLFFFGLFWSKHKQKCGFPAYKKSILLIDF